MSQRYFFTVVVAFAALGLQGSAAPTLPAGFLTQFEWQTDDPLFGGLSAIEIADDGARVTLMTDQGAFATGLLLRSAAGQITDITLSRFALLKALGDRPLAAGRNDSEGLAIGKDGTAFVSFEGAARVLRYARLDGPAQNLPSPDAFARMQPNSALEALAIDDLGALYTIPERSGASTRPYPIYRFRDGIWDSKLALPRTDDYLPVGADFGPDGRLYVLFRQFHGLAGFSSKLVRTVVGEDALGAVEVMLQSPIGFHDNLEGVAIWRDSAGVLRASMVADDNFLPFLSSGIVEYALPD